MLALDQKYGTARALRINYFELGRSYFNLAKYAKAEKAFSDAKGHTGDEPLNWELHYFLARTFDHQNKKVDAVKEYFSALAEKAENPPAIFDALEELATDKSTAAELIEWFQSEESASLLETLQDGFSSEMNLLFGTMHRVTSNLEQALTYFLAIGKGEDDIIRSKALQGLFDIYYSKKQYKEAEKLINDAIDLKAKSKDHNHNLRFRRVMLLISLARNEEAEKELNGLFEYLVHSKTSATIKSKAARQYVRLGSWEKAIELIDHLENLDGFELNENVYSSKIESLISLHKYKNANDTALKALQSFPFDNRLFFMRIQTLIEGDIDIAKGVTLFRESFMPDIDKEPFVHAMHVSYKRRADDNNANFFIAFINMLLEEPVDAYEGFLEKVRKEGLTDDVDDGVKSAYPNKAVYLLDGYAAELKKERESAANHFFEAARRYYWEGKYAKSTQYFVNSKILNDNHRPLYWYLADSYRLLSRIEEAPYNDKSLLKLGLDTWYAELNYGPIENQPDYWSYLVAGRLHNLWFNFEQARYKDETWKALIFTERSLVHQKERHLAWTDLGTYCNYLGLFHCGIEAHEKALSINKDDTFTIQEYTKSLLNIYRFEEALDQIAILDKSIKNSNFTMSWKGFIHYMKMDFDLAIETFQNYLEIVPEDIWSLAMLMESYALANRLEDAKKFAASVLDFSEDPRVIRRELDYARAHFFLGNLDRAIALSKEYNRNSGDTFNSSETLFQYYLCNRDWEEAKEQFENFLAKELRIRSLELHKYSLENFAELDYTQFYERRVQLNSEKGSIEAFIKQSKWVEQINTKIQTITTEQANAQTELENALSLKNYEEGSYSRIAVQAALARISWEKGGYKEALDKYQLLEKHKDKFPEAAAAISYIKEIQSGSKDPSEIA